MLEAQKAQGGWLFQPLTLFSVLVFWLLLGDSIMSYVAPVLLERHIGDPFLMGLMLSSSSIVGMICDFGFGKWFKGRTYAFYLLSMFGFIFFFPLSLLVLPPKIMVFFLAMASWGVYYELLRFSHFHFVHTFFSVDQHARVWGWLETTRALTFIAGIAVVTYVLDAESQPALVAALAAFGMALFVSLVFIRVNGVKNSGETAKAKTDSWFTELAMWRILLRKLWPITLFSIILVMIDSTMWSIGVLLSERLHHISWWSGLLIPVYAVASTLIAHWAPWVAKWQGKKRAAFVAGVVSGMAWIISGIFLPPKWFVLGVFVSTWGYAIALPEITATNEDFVVRSPRAANELVGLDGMVHSAAYVIGPTLAGLIAHFVGYQRTFAVMGLLLALAGLWCLYITPRKIRLPQTELAKVAA